MEKGFLALAIFAAFCFLVSRELRSQKPPIDLQVFYVAGKAWQQGLNPYLPEQREQESQRQFSTPGMIFAYPPTLAPFCLFLAQWSFRTVVVGMYLVNMVALLLLLLGCGYLASSYVSESFSWRYGWLIPPILLHPATGGVPVIGQITLFVLAALVWGWYWARPFVSRETLSGFCFAVALIKPPLSLLPFAWLLFERKWKTIVIAATVGLLAATVSFVLIGFWSTLTGWLHAMQNYSLEAANKTDAVYTFSLCSSLTSLGVPCRTLGWFAPLPFFALWYWRRHYDWPDILSILLSISLLFIGGHDLDLVALIPMAGSLYTHSRESGRKAIMSLVLAVAFFFPSHLVRDLMGIDPLLYHYREWIILALTLWLVRISWR